MENLTLKVVLPGCLRAARSNVIASLVWCVQAQAAAGGKIFLNDPLTMFEPWSPVADGTILPDTFINLLNKGAIAKVPIMVGHVEEEARMFVYVDA